MTTQATPWVLDLVDADDLRLVGGKALNLGKLLRADMPAPGGFVVTTDTYRAARNSGTLPADARAAILAAYARLGRPSVAVRSSATAEDLAEASMAGQYGTLLRIEGDEALLHAITQCWDSITRPGTQAYLREHGLEPSAVAMAVVVQLMVPADVAGVAFSTDPGTGAPPGVMIEASWGLGEAVVSGHVQPDTYRLDAGTGLVVAARIASKMSWYPPRGAGGKQPVPQEKQEQPCLNHRQLRDIWTLCRQVAGHFGCPQDIEWGIAGDKLYLLQSRPITTLAHADESGSALALVRSEVETACRAGRGPWVLHNLGETLPRPTPLTWSVMQRFMSGAGGFGELYRQAGYTPGPRVMQVGFLDLIGGRIYMDCARAPEMFAPDYPFAYDLQKLHADPQAAQDPPTIPVGTARQRMTAVRSSAAVYQRLATLATNLDRTLRDREFPEFSAWCRQEKQRDLARLTGRDLLASWEFRERRVLEEFAPRSLLPSFVAGWAMTELRSFLSDQFWECDPTVLAEELSVGGPPDLTFQANVKLYELACGRIALEQWLAEFGHRGPGEFDLAAPRWREMPEAVTKLAGPLAAGPSPGLRHDEFARRAAGHLQRLQGALSRAAKTELHRRLDLVHRYMSFREDGKYFLMIGYDLLRDVALDAGRRLGLGEGIFYLTRDEFADALRSGFAPDAPVVARQRASAAQARLELPRVISADALDKLGKAELPDDADRYPAFSLSRGTATGPVRILQSPTQAGKMDAGYVLVAPSTDPAWTPLFINAAALVLECGGALSHGAVVAREMGLPAIVLPGATRLLTEGETIIVDGESGAVLRRAAKQSDASVPDATDTRIVATLLPPPIGRIERRSAKWRNVLTGMWVVYLLLTFLLPKAWLYEPSLRLFDLTFWPFVPALGRPATVALLAGGLAVMTMVLQALLTDNRRLGVAKSRSRGLQKMCKDLPSESPRRIVLTAAAAPVAGRILAAALLPVALLLGPMVMMFVWLPARIDPHVASAPPGSSVVVTARVSGEYLKPVTLEVSTPLSLGTVSPASMTLPPIRGVLERYRDTQLGPSDLASQPWEVRAAAGWARDDMRADLEAFLKQGVPPQQLAWQVHASPGASGRFSVTLRTPDAAAVTAYVTLGDRSPPEATEVAAPVGNPIQSVKLTYPRPKTEPVFWFPLHSVLKTIGVAGWLAPWLILYLLVYLPIVLLLRWLLRIP